MNTDLHSELNKASLAVRSVVGGDAEHSPYGFSGAFNYLTCTKYVQMNKGLKEEGYNEPAEKGTAVHELCEAALLLGLNCQDFIGVRSFNGFEVTEEMAECGQLYVSYVRQLLHERPNAQLNVELRVVMSSIDNILYGTSDCVIVDGDTLIIGDYKNGYGLVEVDKPIHITATGQTLDGNAQLMGYLLATMDTLQLWGKIRYFKTFVVQPNGNHIDGEIRGFDYTPEDILEWHKAFKVTFDVARSPDAKLVAGSQCTYCKAAGHCAERLRHTMKIAGLTDSMEVLTPDLIMAVLDEASTIKRTLEAIEKKATLLVKQGKTIKNRKLVKSIVRATCPDPEAFVAEAVKLKPEIEDKLFNHKLIGMSAAKKILPAELVNKFYEKPEAGTVLVPLTDKRPAIAADAVNAGFKPIKPIDKQ